MIFLQILTLFSLLNAKLINERVEQPLRPLDYKTEDIEYIHYSSEIKSEEAAKLVDGNIVYKTIYHHNEYGFRIYPSLIPSTKSPEQHLFLAGCSFTYGEGLLDNQTFGYLLSKKLQDTNVQNISQRGASADELIFLFEHIDFGNLSKQKEGTLLFSMITDHLNRSNNEWEHLVWVDINKPKYIFEDGKWRINGKIGDSLKYKWVKYLSKLGLLDSWISLQSHFRINKERSLIDIYVNKLSYAKSLYLKQFPKGKFIVVDHPLFNEYGKPSVKKYLLETLKKFKIDTWSISYEEEIKQNILKGRPYDVDLFNIKYDGHPNEASNKYYANYILKKLDELKKD